MEETCVFQAINLRYSTDLLIYAFYAAYCVVAEESAGRQLPMAFLERVKDDFVAKYGGGKAATAPANGLNKEFGCLNF